MLDSNQHRSLYEREVTLIYRIILSFGCSLRSVGHDSTKLTEASKPPLRELNSPDIFRDREAATQQPQRGKLFNYNRGTGRIRTDDHIRFTRTVPWTN